MREMIGYCGLDCEKCDAYIATINNDQVLRERTAKRWSELNSTTILPEHINCEGCRMNGVKTIFCESMCRVRKCALEKGVSTCSACTELETCSTVGAIISNNSATLENIILTGYMGSGKTTIGRNIAKLKDYTFVDTDEMIVEQQHRSINEIFATDGEQAFRDMETVLLQQLNAEKKEHLVISTGGGMPLRAENRQLMSRLGKVVYLKACPETIYNRIKGDTTRPLLKCDNPMKRIEEMLAARGPLYEEGATFIIEVDKLRQSEAASEIIARCSAE